MAVGADAEVLRSCLSNISLHMFRITDVHQGLAQIPKEPVSVNVLMSHTDRRSELMPQYRLPPGIHSLCIDRIRNQSQGASAEQTDYRSSCAQDETCTWFAEIAPVVLLTIMADEPAVRLVMIGRSCQFFRRTALSDALWCPLFRSLNAQLDWMDDDELVSRSEEAISAYYEQQNSADNNEPALSYLLM